MAVLRALEQADHPTAEELHARLREAVPGLALKTVYARFSTSWPPCGWWSRSPCWRAPPGGSRGRPRTPTSSATTAAAWWTFPSIRRSCWHWRSAPAASGWRGPFL